MQTKTKTILIISVTLIIGIAIGSVLTATVLRSYRYRDRIDKIRTPEGFVSRFEKIIEPNEQQKEQIHKILLDHFNLIDSTSTRFYSEMKALRDTLNKVLEPILTPEQKKRWQKYQERYKKRKYPHSHRKRDKRDRDN